MPRNEITPHADSESAPPRPLGEVGRTARGFDILSFVDASGHECSVQASSAIGDRANTPGASYLWVGPNEADPRIMASQAAEFGIETDETTGWVPYPVPAEVLLTTRMHLHREQIPALIAVLNRWYDEGTLFPE